jgi:hypothetical protein
VMLFPIFFLPYFFQIPAVVYLGFWFVAQIASDAAVLATESDAASDQASWHHRPEPDHRPQALHRRSLPPAASSCVSSCSLRWARQPGEECPGPRTANR